MAMGFNKYFGGDNVRFGFYWNVREWEAQIVPKEGGELKGRAATWPTCVCRCRRCSCWRR